ncbi:hypothetical protein SCUCBS95973_001994 [Sporothrix curviconia]|uniref:Transcriptional regulator n=1 Tax=Sporothrix curviconia TaxID=1260050 RepID=A0ABP0B320_9PEZI
MASEAEFEKALTDAAHEIFRTDRDNLTVNAVRTRAESNLGLDEGFFKTEEWKGRSKGIVQATADKLLEGEENGAVSEAEADEPTSKKAKPATKPPPKKEATQPAPKKAKAQPAAKKRKAPVKRRRAVESSDEEEEDDDIDDEDGSEDFSDVPSDDDDSVDDDDDEDDFEDEGAARRKKARTADKPKSKSKPKPTTNKAVAALAESGASSPLSELVSEDVDKSAAAEDDGESEMSNVIDESPKKKKKKRAKKGEAKHAREKKPSKRKADDSDSGSSLSVLDDPPPAKRGKKGGARAASSAPSASALSPDEAEVKKLQGQLVKCGVRKIWAFELKSYGDDTKAKIRHLKGMLRDIGMDGRFSESRAREIKERRELEADLEAVQEMDRNWGTHGSSGRPSRSRQRKSLREESSSDEEGEEGVGNGEGGGDGDNKEKREGGAADEGADDDKNDSNGDDDDAPKTSRRSRFGDLAFLGSESESDSE